MLLRISVYSWKIRNSVLFVTITNVLVPVFYHSMVEKQKPSFRHGAHDLFKSSGPDKGLLCHGCVQVWKFFLKVVTAVFDFAFSVFVVFHMQAIYNFSHFKPHQIVRFRKGQWFPSYAELIQITHIVIIMPRSRLPTCFRQCPPVVWGGTESWLRRPGQDLQTCGECQSMEMT